MVVAVLTGVMAVIMAVGSYWRINSRDSEETGDEAETHEAVRLMKHLKTGKKKNCDGAWNTSGIPS